MNKSYLFPKLFVNMKVYKQYSLLFFMFFALTAHVFAQPGATTGSGRTDYLQAEELRKQNKCADAIGKYDLAIKAEPNNYKYYFQKGLCEQKEKRIEDAKRSFQKSIETNKEFTPAYAQMAKIFKEEKDIDQTIYFYEQAAANEKGLGRKLQYELILVNLFLKQDKISDAKAHYEEAKKIDPNNMKVSYYAGEIKMSENEYASAKDDYQKATESPDFGSIAPIEKAQYYYALGLAYNKLNDLENAKKAWQKAMVGPYAQLINQQLMKSNHAYYYKIAASYYLNEENADAETYIAKALEIMPTFSPAFVLRAKIARKQNDIKGAIQNFQSAIDVEKEPANKAKLSVLLAQTQMSDNDYTGAIASLDAAITAMPGNKNLQYLKARALYASGRYGEAVKSAEELVAAATDQKAKSKFSFFLGMAAKKNGDTEKAKAAFGGAMFGPFKPAARMELDKMSGKAEN